MKRDFEQLDDIQQKIHTIPEQLPILPVRDAVIFPNAVIPFTVGLEISIKLSPQLPDDLQTIVINIEDTGRLADYIATNLPNLSIVSKQFVLEQVPVRKRLEFLNTELAKELEVLELRSKIQNQVQEEVGKSQREYFLREQLRAIQRELGESDDTQREIEELRKKIEASGMTEEARKEADRELGRLGRMSPAAAEHSVSRTYLDWLVTLPWNVLTT